MSKQEQRSLSFRHFAAVYAHSKDFPPAARGRILSSSLWTAIDEGNEVFFAPLKQHQPLTYAVLTRECGPVHLLEDAWVDVLTQERRANFHWGLMCEERLVIPNLPAGGKLIPEFVARDLQALPRALHGYYEQTNGMTIPGAMLSALMDYDLLAARDHWRDLDEYRKKTFKRKQRIEKIARDFGDRELRIVFYGSRGDLLLVDYTAKDQRLIHVKDHDFDRYYVLPDAPASVDRYSANAIRGFPEPFEFRESEL